MTNNWIYSVTELCSITFSGWVGTPSEHKHWWKWVPSAHCSECLYNIERDSFVLIFSYKNMKNRIAYVNSLVWIFQCWFFFSGQKLSIQNAMWRVTLCWCKSTCLAQHLLLFVCYFC